MKLSATDALIDKRTYLKIFNNKSQEKEALDAQSATSLLKEVVDKAKHLVKFCNATGTFPQLKMRGKKTKKKLPKKAPSFPVAKPTNKGRLITSPKELMHTLAKEYKDRIRSRKRKEELKGHIAKMHKVTKLKLSKTWMNRNPAFNMEELNQINKDMNKGRARDPRGLGAELFQLSVRGADLKSSLLKIINVIKEDGVITSIMRESMVTTIPKPGSKFKLRNKRGIFK